MFRQIYMIKDLYTSKQFVPLLEEQKLPFKFKKGTTKKLLLFDLDETLIHVKRDRDDDMVQADEWSEESFEPEIEIPVFDPHSGKNIKASFSVRPYAKRCLEFANKHFEVAIFTAGNQWFADPILNFLDPDNTLIQHRFFRQHTSQLDLDGGLSLYIKDLDILTGSGEVTLDDILLIDNNIYSFAFNLENGIPVHSYMGDKTDRCLLQVIKYLDYIKDFTNLRVQNEKVYECQKILDTDIEDYI